MTALPIDPSHYYTVEEFAALPEDNSLRYELQEGTIVVSPRPTREHQFVSGKLYVQIHAQLPPDLAVLQDLDVDLQLQTPRVRVPDLVVVPMAVFGRPGLLRASDVLLAVEILSPRTIGQDTKVKPMEYAEAGISEFWLVDPRRPVTAIAYHLVDGEYEESQRAEHRLTVADPCPLTIDLDALLPD